MTSPNDAAVAAAAKSLQSLRVRLLDLTGKNPLISLDHGSRSTSRLHLRLIGIGIDDAYRRFIEPKSLTLRSLPPMPSGAADENTPAFQSTLDVARHADQAYIATVDGLSPEEMTSAKAARAERKLRDGVRLQLGLKPLKDAVAVGLAEHARNYGIDPSFDLAPSMPDRPGVSRRDSADVPTLLLPEALDRRASKLRDAARVVAEETGISTLYLAFGFLEWFESESSEKAITSPLLLIRADLNRQTVHSRYVYMIDHPGDEMQVNRTLLERLRRDFQISLSDLESDESPSAYLARIEKEVCEGRPRWRVRPWITLSQFPFARLAMYEDLDEERWAQAGGLSSHPLVSTLLGGSETSGGEMFAREHDVDSADVSARVPIMVLEADGSQHSAIYDAMSGKNLVIEGPPGTGKSQTITNLIAAAMADGKRVLFVADKQTALQVVKDRLDKVGLGDFSLEIHSGKARKTDVLESLQQRLNRRRDAQPVGLQRKRAEIESLKTALTSYVDRLNTPFGIEERTIHSAIWADRRRRQIETEEARRLDDVILPKAEQLSDIDVDKLKALLDSFERAADPVLAKADRIEGHPWYGVTRSDLPSTDIEVAQRDVGDLAQRLAEIRSTALDIGEFLYPPKVTLQDLTRTVTVLANLAIAHDHPDRWHLALLDEKRRALATQWILAAKAYAEALAAVGRAGMQVDRLPARCDLDDFLLSPIASAPGLPLDLTIAELPSFAERSDREAVLMEGVVTAAARCRSTVGLSAELTVATMRQLIRVIDLIATAGDRALLFAVPSLMERGATDAVATAASRLSKLRSAETEMTADFNLGKAPKPDDLRRHATAARSSGMLSFMSSALKEATRAHADLRRMPVKASKTQIADELDRIAEHLDALQALRQDRDLAALFGRRFKGLETDTTLAASCAEMGDKIRSTLAGYDDTIVEMRRLVLAADEDRLQAIASLRDRVLTEDVRDAMSIAPDETLLSLGMPEILRGRARVARAYATACARLGFPDAVPLSAHQTILASIATAFDAAIRAAHPAALVEAMGEDLPPPGGDLASLERAIVGARVVSGLNVFPEVRAALGRIGAAALMRDVVPAAGRLLELAKAAETAWAAVQERLGIAAGTFLAGPLPDLPLEAVSKRVGRAAADRDELGPWIGYLVERDKVLERGLDQLLALWDRHEVSIKLSEGLERIFHRSLTREAFARYPELNRFSGIGQEEARAAFRKLDAELTVLGRSSLVSTLLDKPIPQGVGQGRKTDFTDLALIQSELAKKQRHISIRALLDRAGDAVLAMKPCFMMSPLSVAQYVAPAGLHFDLLVIDEASQMRPEDAIGAIARCARMVVVGDPKQLAPSGFFDRGAEDVSEDEYADNAVDAESVLDQSLACFRPARRLRWHYRSRHGSLIAFSNKEFYDSDLIVFPSPAAAGDAQGVSSHYVEGLYRARSNVPEALAVCAAAVEHMRSFPHRSLGIATLNAPQRQVIQDEMARLETSEPIVEHYLQRWGTTLERFFVKNLENVQGDERDTIFVSTVFGPSESGGPVRQNFGPINGSGGHRRLNVLFTRAKHQLRVFTSMRPEQITAGDDSPRGARILRSYLTFAATGRLEAGEMSGREADSDFEIFVRDRIRAAGYECEMQVGVAGFFIDLAVRDPRRPDVFLLGVECDGASYHSSKSARDRDILRQEILEGLGWTIYRIWSTDWFRNPNGETAKLVDRLEKLRLETRATVTSQA